MANSDRVFAPRFRFTGPRIAATLICILGRVELLFRIVFHVVRHLSAIFLHVSRRFAALHTARLTGLRLPAPLAALLLILAAAAPMRAQTFAQQSPAASPAARLGASMAYDAATGQVVLFSGWATGGGTLLSDTWVWNGINWTQESPATSPAARGYASMVYDAALGQVVLFGGVGNTAPGSNGFFNDTWVWNGTNWTEESPTTSPSGREYSAMAYYAPGNLVVLFAGDNSTGVLDDTWTWDGTNWTLRTPATSPPARLAASMVYDAVEGQVVLFGGDGDGGVRLADTWVLDGSGWTQESPTTSPSGRGSSAVAYDALLGQVVLFGGANSGGLLADTWVWNGTNWIQENPAASPSARWASAMAYDAAQGQVILFGGSNSTSSPVNALGDTWAYSQGDFGPVSIGATSAAQTFNFSIPGGTTVGSIGVLTEGAPNLDFTDAGGDTCTATTYTSTTNCTVNVQFAPKFAGLRMGAVIFKDGSGNVLSNTYVNGIGTGPQIAFEPASQISLGGGFNIPYGVAVDGADNVYVADAENGAVKEMPAGCASSACVTTLGGGFSYPNGIAVDGSGNVYVADLTVNVSQRDSHRLCLVQLRHQAGRRLQRSRWRCSGRKRQHLCCRYQQQRGERDASRLRLVRCVTALGGGFSYPYGVAVDASGNVYVADSGNNVVKEIPPGCASSSCVTTLGGGFSIPSERSGGRRAATSMSPIAPTVAVNEMPSGCASSSCVTTISGASPAVALEGGGNVYRRRSLQPVVKELNAAAPPTLTFSTTTAVGSTDTTDGTRPHRSSTSAICPWSSPVSSIPPTSSKPATPIPAPAQLVSPQARSATFPSSSLHRIPGHL